MTTRKSKKKLAKEEALAEEPETKTEIAKEAPTPSIAETLEPEVVNQTLLSQSQSATKRNDAIVADLSKRLVAVTSELSAITSDLDKIVRVQV